MMTKHKDKTQYKSWAVVLTRKRTTRTTVIKIKMS